jgi:hypothetical protein
MKNVEGLVIICLISCFLSSLYFIFWIKVAESNQLNAYNGDAKAAKRIILPFYQPLTRCGVGVYAFLSGILALMFIGGSSMNYHRLLQYYGFILLTIYFFIPLMLLQTSASTKALLKTITLFLFPWFFVCTLTWCLSFILIDVMGLVFLILFIIFSFSIPCFVSVGILLKLLYSRVQVGSLSNRNTTELLLFYTLCYGIYMIGSVFSFSSSNLLVFECFFTIISFLSNQLFPFAMYRTLIADSKFWRGLGKHNSSGIDVGDSLRNSGIDVHRPTMELNVISSSFQAMMADIHDITVDFAYLQLERLIGEGATAKVYRGKLKGKLVAIKLSTPPEITEEVIDVFVAESKVASSLIHRNVVQFLGKSCEIGIFKLEFMFFFAFSFDFFVLFRNLCSTSSSEYS